MMAFLATKAPEQLDTVARIHTIPAKKRAKPQVTFLTPLQVQALLDAIDTDTWTGRRDRAMFTLAAQTGLRLSEITALSIASVHLGAAAHVACTDNAARVPRREPSAVRPDRWRNGAAQGERPAGRDSSRSERQGGRHVDTRRARRAHPDDPRGG
jgi:integrase